MLEIGVGGDLDVLAAGFEKRAVIQWTGHGRRF
jgi:hypothetical protein